MDPGSICLLSIFDIARAMGIKYDVKELQMNGRGRPSDNEWRWRRFKLYECFLVCFVFVE